MKAISLWEPWASAMARGLKAIETRHWGTNYRGDLVICAAKRKMTNEEWSCARLYMGEGFGPAYGCAVCVVEVYDCWPTERLVNLRQPLSAIELSLGNYSVSRFGWMTRNLRKLERPIPVCGHQGFFNLTPDEKRLVREQLGGLSIPPMARPASTGNLFRDAMFNNRGITTNQ